MKTDNRKLVYDSIPMESVRSKDSNGFLHVAVSNISKEMICPYSGREIPFSEAHGFSPDGVYRGFRPASELQKPQTLKSLNGIPILLNHHEDFANNPQKEWRIGSTGTDAEFKAPYLTNSLHFTDEDAIRRIEDGSMRELSLGYRYDPVFEKGEHNGEPYDFIMTNITCNHVALVEAGRCGSDVVVGDSKLTEEQKNMADNSQTKQAEEALAETAKNAVQTILDLHDANPVTEEVQDKQETSDVTEEKIQMDEVENKETALAKFLAECVQAGLDPEKVKASLEEIRAESASAQDEEPVEAKDEAPAAEKTAGDEEPAEEKAEEAITLDAETAKACGLDADDPNVQKAFAEGVKFGEKKDKEAADSDENAPKEKKEITGDSLDNIVKLVSDRITAKFQAAEEVRGTLGCIRATAYDSAGAIYRDALKKMGISSKDMNESACRATYRAVTKVNQQSKLAMDSAPKSNDSALSAFFNKVNVGV